MPAVRFDSNWSISLPSTAPEAQLAARELQRGLHLLTGLSLPSNPAGPSGRSIRLQHASSGADGFTWQAAQDGFLIYGESPRGLLFAVYSFLEALSFRWIGPGADGERYTPAQSFVLPDMPVHAEPGLPGRCLILGHYAFLADCEDWIVWAARNRLNTLFIHVLDDPFVEIGACPVRQWPLYRERVLTLARERGLTIEFGGHGLAGLLPRNLFKTHPEAFRLHAGKRTPDHNFCPSSPFAAQQVRQNAQAWFRANPGMDVYHLWQDDIVGGGWCECERCREFSPSEQALLAVNLAAQALAQEDPRAQIAFLSYHETEPVPAKVTPRSNVCMLWAPRMRCYAHSTDDPACQVNSPHYPQTLHAQIEHFSRAGSPPARVFEYYLDAILFKNAAPPLLDVMQADLRFYRAAGVHTVQTLMTGGAPWSAPQINAWAFARLAWDAEQDADALLADFCRAVFQTASPALPSYYRALEAAFRIAIDIVPDQIHLDLETSAISALSAPSTDMGDPVYAPAAVLAEKCRAAQAIPALLEEAQACLDLGASEALPQAVERERIHFSLLRAWLEFDRARVNLYRCDAARTDRRELGEWLAASTRAENAVLAWGAAHVADPRLKLSFGLLPRLYWDARLSYLRARHPHLRWMGWLSRVHGLLRLGRHYSKMRHLFWPKGKYG
jgi:hypothetical protein